VSTRVASLVSIAAIVTCAALASAQGGGTPATGNPTPGTAQPDPPNVANRVMFVGCLHAVGRTAPNADSNIPTNSRFELTKAETLVRVAPPGTGPLVEASAVRPSSKAYRLEGIDSQFSPFVGAKVEITGEVKRAASAGPPTLVVEFVQRIASRCS
jgi:hypothetical protein